MRRIRIAGLCLVAVFAMSAIASATASAEAPEFGQCLKNATEKAEPDDSRNASNSQMKTAGRSRKTEKRQL